MPQELIAARRICKAFGGVQALQNVSVTLHRGEVRCLVGENGSGKSTLIKILAGADRPDAGAIVVGGQSFPYLEPIAAIRAGIQVIYQDFSLFPNLTVAENLALNTELERGSVVVNWRRIRRTAMEAIEKLGCPIDLGKEVGELSVAERQLVAISRALLHNARLIIMDEPTAALTHKEVDTLFRIIADLKGKGVSILFVSHKLREVLEVSDAITVLRNGQKVAEGQVSEFRPSDLVCRMTGRRLSPRSPSAADRVGASAVRVTGLCRKGAFEDVNFAVGAGEIVGITGLLGSGRTELALALFGLAPADAGQIRIHGQATRIRSVPDAIRAGIAYVPEDRLAEGVFAEQSIEKNVAVSSIGTLANRIGWIRFAPLRALVGRWMESLRIQATSARTPVGHLSGGNQQKVVLGRWLATRAKVLILNGPTIGVDIGAKADVHEKIRELAGQGMAVILISDDLPELVEVCQRVLIMHRGRIVKELPAARCGEEALAAELDALP